MSVVAGVIVLRKVIELNQYVGQGMDTPAAHRISSKVKEKVQALRTKIEEQTRTFDVEIHAGLFAS